MFSDLFDFVFCTIRLALFFFLSFFFLMIRRPPRSTLFLHDALPISQWGLGFAGILALLGMLCSLATNRMRTQQDRKSTRLNSSHEWISYAVFCLKKKKKRKKKIPARLKEVVEIDKRTYSGKDTSTVH